VKKADRFWEEESEMSVAQLQRRLFTVEEYLAIERADEFRNEYLEGEIYAMSGGSPEHSTIATNLTIEIGSQLKNRPCQAFSSDMKVRSATMSMFAYPDLTIVCDEPEFHDRYQDALLNPIVLFEVLSPSTEGYDRGPKFTHYQTIGSLRDYVLVAQDEPRMEHFVRHGESQWLLTTVEGLDAKLHIASIDCTILLSEAYHRVKFVPKSVTPLKKRKEQEK
jgi:Uma2 family endonuclease